MATRYTSYYQWVCEYSHGQYRIGLSGCALQMLGEVVYLELPEIGQKINKDQPCGFIESNKAVVDLLMPLNGLITENNTNLPINLALINQSPYQDGWLFTIKPDNNLDWSSFLLEEPSLNGEETHNV